MPPAVQQATKLCTHSRHACQQRQYICIQICVCVCVSCHEKFMRICQSQLTRLTLHCNSIGSWILTRCTSIGLVEFFVVLFFTVNLFANDDEIEKLQNFLFQFSHFQFVGRKKNYEFKFLKVPNLGTKIYFVLKLKIYS